MANVRTINGKRGKTYRVQMMRNGQKIDRTFQKKKDAEQFLARITTFEDLADALTSVALTTSLFHEVAKQFLDQYQGRDRSAIQRVGWWADRLGDKPVGKITRQHVKDGLNSLLNDEKAQATVNRYQAALSAVFAWFNDEHDTKHNPAREVRQQTEDNARTRFLSDDEIANLLNAAQASKWERLHLLLHMALTTGARRSELINLRWCDIDFQQKTALLERTKNGSQRSLALTTSLIAELMPWREIGESYIFPHPSRLNAPFSEFDHHWRSCLLQSGITNFRFHDLRHTSASIMAKTDASLLELADHLGHKTMAMVKRYAHLCTGHKVVRAESTFGNLTRGAAR
ncbi:tyrosine-type recombinase/integrase [Aeromonas veronii]|uniref:tyrosine-type recombinase/integrase n=1 Tax=Aeromonas veronii TaxID=654 RepID=UPI0018F14AEF|nr:site-specific integrase [Aeromonas veronii]MBJ7582636.1 tyrosine-type recombinase/integrase [Aeromonas veronii]